MHAQPARKHLQQLADGLAADLGGNLTAAWSPFTQRLCAAALLPALRIHAALRSVSAEDARRGWISAGEAAHALWGLLELGSRNGLVADEFSSRAGCLEQALAAMSGDSWASAGMRI